MFEVSERLYVVRGVDDAATRSGDVREERIGQLGVAAHNQDRCVVQGHEIGPPPDDGDGYGLSNALWSRRFPVERICSAGGVQL